MYDKCCWPSCHNESDIVFAGKPLCDKHWDKAASESVAVRKRAYGTLKIPFGETPVGRLPTFEESSCLCCFPGCSDCVSLIVNDKPFCNDHWKKEKDVEFDGIWRDKYKSSQELPKQTEVPAPRTKAEPEPQPEMDSAEDEELRLIQERLLAGDFDEYE